MTEIFLDDSQQEEARHNRHVFPTDTVPVDASSPLIRKGHTSGVVGYHSDGFSHSYQAGSSPRPYSDSERCSEAYTSEAYTSEAMDDPPDSFADEWDGCSNDSGKGNVLEDFDHWLVDVGEGEWSVQDAEVTTESSLMSMQSSSFSQGKRRPCRPARLEKKGTLTLGLDAPPSPTLVHVPARRATARARALTQSKRAKTETEARGSKEPPSDDSDREVERNTWSSSFISKAAIASSPKNMGRWAPQAQRHSICVGADLKGGLPKRGTERKRPSVSSDLDADLSGKTMVLVGRNSFSSQEGDAPEERTSLKGKALAKLHVKPKGS